MITLKERNIKKSRDARKKGNLPKIVTGICPLCKINLYGKKRRPQFIVNKTTTEKKQYKLLSHCDIKICPF
jgi:hypothetical protein